MICQNQFTALPEVQLLSLYPFQAWTPKHTSFACIAQNWMPPCCLSYEGEVYATEGNVKKENSYPVSFQSSGLSLGKGRADGIIKYQCEEDSWKLLLPFYCWETESQKLEVVGVPPEKGGVTFTPLPIMFVPPFLFSIICCYQNVCVDISRISCCLRSCHMFP